MYVCVRACAHFCGCISTCVTSCMHFCFSMSYICVCACIRVLELFISISENKPLYPSMSACANLWKLRRRGTLACGDFLTHGQTAPVSMLVPAPMERQCVLSCVQVKEFALEPKISWNSLASSLSPTVEPFGTIRMWRGCARRVTRGGLRQIIG